MSTWIAIIAVGAISFALRAVPLAVLGRVSISDGTDRMLRHAGAAAQTALLVGAVQHGGGSGSSVAAIAGTAVSLVVATRRASMLRVVVTGGLVYVAVTAAVSLAS